MEQDCQIAFKEWAVVCEALRQRRQSIVLRKGGIDEGREGFRVLHDRFWLLPTGFHQHAEALNPTARDLADAAVSTAPAPGTFPVDLFARVEQVYLLTELEKVLKLSDLHVLSEETVRQRFFYREPRLFVLAVRIYQAETRSIVYDSPKIAGCKSWVDLPEALRIDTLQPVLDDHQFAERMQSLQTCLQ